MAFSGSLLCAAPQGGQVRAGQAQITQQGKVTNINQSSQKAAINWQKFNIAADETVNFKQPNAHSVTLNRVIGNEKSVINGAMNANGKVFLLNPHGTLIGKGAKINVGGLVASTANISDDDFMQGKYRFTGNGSGAVENYGEIAVPAGGVVALIAPIVKNNGNIKADSASVLLASAEHFSITLPENGDFAYTIDKGTLQGLVDNGGAVLANGGLVVLTAAGLDSVKKSVVRHTGIIQANTVANKNGKILLLGDLDNSRTEVSGSLKAEAPISGDGGFIETSANKVQIDDNAFISTKATNGKTGEWLIDPTDYTVAATGGDMTGQAVSNALQNNNLTLKSTNGKADGKGDVVINDTINWNKNTLTLNAQNDIHINKTINGSGSAKLALQYGQASADGGESNYYLDKDVRVNLPAGQNFSTQKGSAGEKVDFEVIHKMPEIIKDNDGKYFSQFPTHKIAIGKDIDLSYTKNYQGFEGWEIYGTNSSPTVFTGLGHQLNNLYINATIDNSVGNNVGFIRYAGESFEVDNIHLRNVDISGEHRVVGGLIASNNTGTVGGQTVNGTGKIRNSSVTGKVSGDYKVGGLIGSSDNATIKDSWTDTKVTGLNNDVGGLVGYAKDNNILNSYATGDVTGVSDVGGLIGDADGSTSISNSYATGNVIGSEVVGGLVAVAAGNNISISDSYATGNVVGSETVGGLVGVLAGVKDFDENDEPIKSDTPANISNSYATGKVVGERDVGGLVGETWNAQISKSHATGNVQASGTQSHSNGNVVISSAGGLVGEIEDTKVTQSYATGAVSGVRGLGGLTGYAKNSTISQSYSSSNVTGEERIGGLVGEAQNITIENSYAAGTLTEQSSGTPNVTGYNGEKLAFVGGLVGAVAEYHDGESNTATTTKVKNSYFSGSLNTVPSSSAHGAVIGGNIDPNTQFVAENVYYDDKGGEQDSGSANGIDYGTPLTPAQMKQQSSFIGFDFNSIWEIKEGQSTPTLRQSVLAQMLLKVYATNAHNPYQGNTLINTYGTYAPNNGYRLELDGKEKSNDWIIKNPDITGTLTFGGTWTNAVNAGDYTVIPQGLSSNKYTIEYIPGTFTIDPYAISITGNSVYSGTAKVGFNSKNTQINPISQNSDLAEEVNKLNIVGTADIGIYLPNGKFVAQTNGKVRQEPYAINSSNYNFRNADGTVNKNFTLNGADSRWTITPKEVTLTGSVKKSSIANGFTIHDAVSNELNGLLAKDKGQLTVTGKGYLNNNGTLNNKTTFKLNGDSANNYSLKYGQWTIIDDSSQGGSGGSTGGSTGGTGSGTGTGGSAGQQGGNSGNNTSGNSGGGSQQQGGGNPQQSNKPPKDVLDTYHNLQEQHINNKPDETISPPDVSVDSGSETVVGSGSESTSTVDYYVPIDKYGNSEREVQEVVRFLRDKYSSYEWLGKWSDEKLSDLVRGAFIAAEKKSYIQGVTVQRMLFDVIEYHNFFVVDLDKTINTYMNKYDIPDVLSYKYGWEQYGEMERVSVNDAIKYDIALSIMKNKYDEYFMATKTVGWYDFLDLIDDEQSKFDVESAVQSEWHYINRIETAENGGEGFWIKWADEEMRKDMIANQAFVVKEGYGLVAGTVEEWTADVPVIGSTVALVTSSIESIASSASQLSQYFVTGKPIDMNEFEQTTLKFGSAILSYAADKSLDVELAEKTQKIITLANEVNTVASSIKDAKEYMEQLVNLKLQFDAIESIPDNELKNKEYYETLFKDELKKYGLKSVDEIVDVIMEIDIATHNLNNMMGFTPKELEDNPDQTGLPMEQVKKVKNTFSRVVNAKQNMSEVLYTARDLRSKSTVFWETKGLYRTKAREMENILIGLGKDATAKVQKTLKEQVGETK